MAFKNNLIFFSPVSRFFSLLVVAMLLIGCNSEQSQFDSAVEQKSRKALRKFITDFPESPLKEEATFRLVENIDKVSAYLLFLHHYPQGKFAPQAKEKIDSLGMVFVKGGTFIMGCDTCQKDEKPAHEVELRDFYMDKTEVTVAQFAEFVATTKYRTDAEREGSSSVYRDEDWFRLPNINWRHDVAGKLRDSTEYNHPVVHISWFDAREYALWAGKRLPTEAEWEYAARGGQKSKNYIYSGSNNPAEVAWFDGNANDNTNPVAQKRPNELGIYDMSGNVYEWCGDWFTKKYYSISPRNNPTGPQTGNIVSLRGGGWNYAPSGLRCTNRINAYPLHWYGGIGFRCVADKPADLDFGELVYEE